MRKKKRNSKQRDMVRDAVNYLFSNGLLKYDIIIPKGDLECALDCFYDENNPWEYIGRIILLEQELKRHGFWSTAKCQDLYILPKEKMADKTENHFTNQIRKDDLILTAMTRVDTTDLSEKQRLRHHHATRKASMLLMEAQNVLSKIKF